jgi:hypothetical protein
MFSNLINFQSADSYTFNFETSFECANSPLLDQTHRVKQKERKNAADFSRPRGFFFRSAVIIRQSHFTLKSAWRTGESKVLPSRPFPFSLPRLRPNLLGDVSY